MKIRKKYNRGFTTIDNAVLNDSRLTLKAKGLFGILWQQPDDWEYYEVELVKRSADGRDSLRSGLRELENFGYLTRRRVRDEKGRLTKSEWILTERPMSENPTLDKDNLENPTLLNTNITNTNITNNNSSSTSTAGESERTDFLVLAEQVLKPSAITREDLIKDLETHSPELLSYAMRLMNDQTNKPNYKYFSKIVDKFDEHGVTTVDQAQKLEAEFQKKKQERKQTRNLSKNNHQSFVDVRNEDHNMSDEEAERIFFGDDKEDK